MTSLLTALVLVHPAFAGAALTPGKTYDLPKPGHFDVVAFDGKKNRVLAAHSGAGCLAVLDTKTGKVTEVETGPINGIAVSGKLNRIFVGGGNQKLVAIDRDSLHVVGAVGLGGPADTMALDSKRDRVYVGHDDGTEVWVVDGKTMKVVGSVTVEEAPEFVAYHAKSDKLFQNIKSSDHLQVIDGKTMKVAATWGSGEMKSPHGLALDGKKNRVYSVGRNGKLLQYDLETGKILATVPVAQGVDQIAFDSGNSRVYCPGGGKLTVVDVAGANPKVLETIDIPQGVHSLAVDHKTHDVWVAYGDDKSAHIAQFRAQ